MLISERDLKLFQLSPACILCNKHTQYPHVGVAPIPAPTFFLSPANFLFKNSVSARVCVSPLTETLASYPDRFIANRVEHNRRFGNCGRLPCAINIK